MTYVTKLFARINSSLPKKKIPNEMEIFVGEKNNAFMKQIMYIYPARWQFSWSVCRLHKYIMMIINNTWGWVVFLRSLKSLQYKPTFQSKSFKLLSLSWSHHANLSAYPRLKARQTDAHFFEQYDSFQN